MTGKKILPLTGILTVLLVIAAFIVGGETPDTDASTKEVVDFYTQNDTDQQFSAALLAWAAVAFLFFAGALRKVLRGAEGDAGALSAVSFAGGIVFAVGLAVFAAISFTIGDAVDELKPSAIQTLHVMNNDFFFPTAVGLATFLLATGIAAVKTGALPKWFGWLTVVLGVVAVSPVGFVVFLAMGIWLIIASVLLMSRVEA